MSPKATYLDNIVAHHRELARRDERDRRMLARKAMQVPSCRGFARALNSQPTLAVIAEIKRKSPSKGILSESLDVRELARRYQSSNAAAISVLTDEKYFGGSLIDLEEVRECTSVPLLRKDFTVSVSDIYDAKIAGADAILLIVGAVTNGELRTFYDEAMGLGLDVIVEIHSIADLDIALEIGSKIIGINQRDLSTFKVDPQRAELISSKIPAGIYKIAESGITSIDQAVRLGELGFDAVLIGEALVTSNDMTNLLSNMAAIPTYRART